MKQLIIQITKQAGKTLLKYFGKDPKLAKLRGSVKAVSTKYDKMVDKMIINQISKKYPRHSLLTEESGLIKRGSDWLWIVDSLDGTVNFASGNPLFAVCVALMHKNELVLGTVYAPAINEFYFAQKGKGAYLNGKKISVSKSKNFKKSYLLFCDGGEKNRQKTLKIITKIYPRVTDIRKLGSAGIEAAWVALGRAEGYVTTKINPWDVASGVLLTKEAGGRVTNFKGENWKCRTDNLIFSNGKIHKRLLTILRK